MKLKTIALKIIAHSRLKAYPPEIGGGRELQFRLIFNIMMAQMKSFFACILLLSLMTTTSAGTITSVRALTEPTTESGPRKFDIRARVDCIVDNGLYPYQFLSVADETGSAFVSYTHDSDAPVPRAGDIIHTCGWLETTEANPTPITAVEKLTIVGHEKPAQPIDVSLRDVNKGLYDWKPVRIRGLIRDVILSETIPGWAILSICDNGEIVRIHTPLAHTSFADLDRLVGMTVDVSGFANPSNGSSRLFAGCDFHCSGLSAIRIVNTGPEDAFAAPSARSLLHKSPAQIATSGRVRIEGTVVCTWGKNMGLVRTKDIGCVQVEFAASDIPNRNDCIEVAGFPQSDLFHILLSRVRWRRCKTPVPDTLKVIQTDARGILFDEKGLPSAKPHYHGRTIRISGRVRSLPSSSLRKEVVLLEDGDCVFPVDISSDPVAGSNIRIGCLITLVGTCIINAEYWKPGILVPQIKNFSVVVNNANDIKILEYPPWWTKQRLILLVSALLVGSIAILFWNILLRKASLRKGRELMREQLGHVKAELKTEERTRLAVELHDSLAQNLTGVSLEIDTAIKIADKDPKSMKSHLGVAARSLKSCRDELRNCLWDLRNRALETKAMDEAIRQTLAPHVAGIDVTIRFNVPRERISDNTTHAILRIIRELTLNAIRHGGAKKIWIAGSIDGEGMHFSVRDNGCGFDPSHIPGFAEGHYGLLGIQERIDEFEGEFELKSTPGKGTKAMVSLKVPQEKHAHA